MQEAPATKIKCQWCGREIWIPIVVFTLSGTDEFYCPYCGQYTRHERSKSMNLGERVKKLRKRLGLTQKQFASRVPGKIDYTYIGKIERGHQYPSLKLLERIGATFSKPMSYFFKDEDQPTIHETARKMSWRVTILPCLLSNYLWSLGWFRNCHSCHLKQRELCQKVRKIIEEG